VGTRASNIQVTAAATPAALSHTPKSGLSVIHWPTAMKKPGAGWYLEA